MKYRPRRAGKKWLEGAPEYVLDCFDHKRWDRYTILFGGSLLDDNLLKDRKVMYLGMNEIPTHPWFGVSMWGEIEASWRPSRYRVRWLDLPEDIRNHVIARAIYDPQ